MAALHRLRFLRDQPAGVGVEHAGGAGVERGIDGEDQHGTTVSLFATKCLSLCTVMAGLVPAIHAFLRHPKTCMPGTQRARRARSERHER